MNTQFEFFASDTPKKNGIIERAFATICDRAYVMLNFTNVEGDIRESL